MTTFFSRRRGMRPWIAVAALTAAFVAPGGVARAAGPAASVQLPPGYYTLAPGPHAMWALLADEFHYAVLYRIDPDTLTVTGRVQLDYPAAGLAVAYGSVWVTDYYGSSVHRYTAGGREQAVVPTGLQPQFVHAVFGSIWTSDHHGHSLTRIDPATNGVIARVDVGARMFRDGPQDFTHDATHLYVLSSNLTRLQRVDASDDSVQDLAELDHLPGYGPQWTPGPLGGTVWMLGGGSTIDGYDVLGVRRTRVHAGAGLGVVAMTRFAGLLWYCALPTGDHTAPGVVQAVDPVTGQPVSAVSVDDRPDVLAQGFGSLWAVAHSGQVDRFTVG